MDRIGIPQTSGGGGAEGSGAITSRSELPTFPAILPGRSLRRSHGIVVALRTADLTGTGGTDYGLDQTDADGLMLALLTPRELGADPAVNTIEG